uniref:Anti-sigma-L factor RslA n=1 Tax=Mycobacterium riyadhense TaxID=486698 RepID=A0A653F438_9MYCO|nr:Anti-sigma-L factor RslA [Mycobacterium riyadhense]
MTSLWGLGPPADRDVCIDDTRRYPMWDAAYVLGSLSATDRREFQAHMARCPGCRQAVAELSDMPALLSQLDLDVLAAINAPDHQSVIPSMSPHLLASLLATVRWRRRRTRLMTWAAAAAAAVLAISVFAGVHHRFTTSPPPQSTVSALQMAQVGTKLLTSTVWVTPEHWGTSIKMRSDCLAPLDAPHDRLAMVVVDRDGSRTRLATWVAEPGRTARPAGSISTPATQIAAVQVVYADTGQVLLERSL